jgi:hypothetical protein
MLVELNATGTIFNETHPPDLKFSNILLLPSDVDSIVMHELADFPSTFYELPKTIPLEEVPFHALSSVPLMFTGLKSDYSTSLGYRRLWTWTTRYVMQVDNTSVTFPPAEVQREHLSDVVQPYPLRAPEVVFKLGLNGALEFGLLDIAPLRISFDVYNDCFYEWVITGFS